MENVILSLLINGMMALLLLVTIVYCVRLNSRIRLLQDSKSELATIIREFDESTRRATDSIAEIHAATSRLSENIQHKIDKANFIANDLDAMIEKGNKLTGRVDPSPTQRPAPSPQPRPQAAVRPAEDLSPTAGSAAARRTRQRSRAEQELMQVLGTKDESGR